MPTATAPKAGKLKPAVPAKAPAGLNRIGEKVKVNEVAAAPKKDEIPIIQIEGDTCKRFNEAKKQIKDAEATINELEGVMHERAMEKIFAHNCAPDCLQPITSVKIQDVAVDEDDETIRTPGEVTRVSFTARYNNCDTAQVDAAFQAFAGRDINNYVVETIAAKFDDSVFMDADGNFDLVAYNKFRIAIEKVAKDLGMIDKVTGIVKSPLGTKRVLKTKPDFHEKRFKDFDEEENFTLAKVLPNTIQCAAVRTV
jgi:hypothetical protein